MVPLIVRVYSEGDDVLATDVPITPDTTCRDIIECCRDPGEERCALVETWGTCERTLGDDERPLQILQDWGSHQVEIRFMLRYLQQPAPSSMIGGRNNTRNGMKEPGLFGETPSDGVELTLGELQDMATRQQHQIDSQHQLLVAKEQRLRFLKHQEARAHQVASENERLRRLRDRVEAQEQKLRKLRALRGQVDHNKVSNASLTSDLDSIRGLFNEKEKELSLAVAKVEELTRQLEEVKRGKGVNRDQGEATSPAVLELDKLRRELMYRNKLNEQQNARLSQQREALTQRQEEMTNIDKRISELQDRLHQKRLLNQQLANQITAASHKASGHQNRGVIPGGPLQHPYQHQGKLLRPVTSGNIAAVEPYHHVPVSAANPNPTSQQGGDVDKPLQRHPNPSSIGFYQKGPPLQNREAVTGPFLKHSHQPDGKATSEIKQERGPSQDDIHTKLLGNANHQPILTKKEEEFYLPEFGGSKSDPKYQTLPYNTKFTVNFLSGSKIPSTTDKNSVSEDTKRNDTNESAKNNNNNINNINNNINYVGSQNPPPASTVHGMPMPPLTASKGHMKGVSNQNQPDLPANYQTSSKALHLPNHSGLRPYGLPQQGFGHQGPQFGLTRGQPVGGTSSTTSSTSSLATNSSASSSNSHHQKPVSSVAPTSVHQKPSPIYQTSSTKIQPVQPQTLSATPQGLRDLRLDLSPPQNTSTPQGTPEVSTPKPALPPKPAVPIKPAPPPRQAHAEDDLHKGHRMQDHHSHQVPLPPPLPHDDESNLPPCPPPPPPTDPPEEFSSNRKPPAPTPVSTNDALPIIKARPLTIKKQPISEHPKLKLSNLNGNGNSTTNSITTNNNVHVTINRRIEMPPAFLFPENEAPPADLVKSSETSANVGPTNSSCAVNGIDDTDRVATKDADLEANGKSPESHDKSNASPSAVVDTLNNINHDQQMAGGDSIHIVRRRKGNLKASGPSKTAGRRVSFDPLALLLDAALEGELELVKRTAGQVTNPSAANDEGITALHNAICAGHLEIVKFLVEFGCDVNAQDSDGWTPLHCAASCNNLAMVRFLVEHGACIFATTLSDHETAAEKCEEDEEGFDGCSEYLYSVQEKLGILHNGIVYAVFDYEAHHPDELSFKEGEQLIVLRKGDESEREWWWSKLGTQEGYIPRNLLGLYPRVHPSKKQET